MTDSNVIGIAGRRKLVSMLSLLTAMALPIMTGCASGDIRAYHGDAPAPSQLVIIEIAPDLELVSVDGNPSWSGRSTKDQPLTLSFSEGDHDLTIRLRREDQEGQIVIHQITTTLSEPVTIDGYFRGERRYRIGFTESVETWKPTISDVTPDR